MSFVSVTKELLQRMPDTELPTSVILGHMAEESRDIDLDSTEEMLEEFRKLPGKHYYQLDPDWTEDEEPSEVGYFGHVHADDTSFYYAINPHGSGYVFSEKPEGWDVFVKDLFEDDPPLAE